MNKALCVALLELGGLYDLNGDEYRANAYRNAVSQLSKITEPITLELLKQHKLKGIGVGICGKIDEFNKTGKIAELTTLRKSTPLELFGILGVGDKTVKSWIKAGVTDLMTLSMAVAADAIRLTRVQKLGLLYYKDLNQRIPRDEVTKLSKIMKAVVEKIQPGVFEIVGSYKRGSKDSGDVDIIITTPRYDSRMLDKINNVLEQDPNYVAYITRGHERTTFLYKSPFSKPTGKVRQIDILYVKSATFPAALLYFTGSSEFNQMMRGVAKKQGYKLNQNGLFYNGKLVKVASEKDIFDKLGMKYVQPVDR